MNTQLAAFLFSISLTLGARVDVQAQSCGDTVTGVVTLTRDLNCPSGTGLFVASGATLDCAGHTITGGDRAQQSGLYLREVSNAVVRNCTLQHFEAGIRLSKATDCTVQSNIAQLNTRYGIEVTQGSAGAIIQHNTLFSNSDEGLHVSGSVDRDAAHQIIDNPLTGNSAEGVYLLYAHANTVSGNIIQNHGAAALYVKGSNRNPIHNNTLTSNALQLVAGSQLNLLTDNTIRLLRIPLRRITSGLLSTLASATS